MHTKLRLKNTHLCPQAADELIGYLYLLIDELQLKYHQEELAKVINNLDKDESQAPGFNDELPF
ncbi:MAG: hypothetical protein COB83_13575 [Gammaproteobacteria bacterium]|nr:MAG: hypothetical protein COB83_13575 [Gammaproteobacteria bacterium]